MLVINAGYTVRGQADNAEFEISLSAETAEEGKEKGIRFLDSDEYEKMEDRLFVMNDLYKNYELEMKPISFFYLVPEKSSDM